MVQTMPSSLLIASNNSPPPPPLSSKAPTPSVDHLSPAVMVVEEEIPTIDYSSLFSSDPVRRSNALRQLSTACEDYGFFNLVSHGIGEGVMEGVVRGISEFLGETAAEEKRKYREVRPESKILWDSNCHAGENREYLKLVARPQLHCPPNSPSFREALGEYQTRFHEVKLGLARAMSYILGQEESYIENAFNLESGFDVTAMNIYPPNLHSEAGSIRLPEHTDPGFIVSLVQNVDGGLQILTHQGKWVDVHIPPNAILIQVGEHLEVLTNGKYKSHIHRVLGNYKARRVTIVTLHGPSSDTCVAPAPEFVDDSRPPAYRGMTYLDGLTANDHYEIEVQSCIEQHRIVL